MYQTGLLTAMALLILILASRSYLRQRSRIFLVFGGAMISIALGSLLGTWGLSRHDGNLASTLNGGGTFLSASYHLGGVLMLTLGSTKKTRTSYRGAVLTCVMVYGGTALVFLLISLLAINGSFPTFLEKDRGPTLGRQVVLTLAGIAYVMSAVLLIALHARTRMRFLSLYSNGLFLTALGIMTYMSPISGASLVSWAGTLARFAASCYFLAAIAAGIRETRLSRTSLPDYLSELFRSHLEDQVKARTRDLVETNRELELARLEMKNLASNLVHVRDEERRKVAQEIHDELGQVLVGLKMDLQWLARRLGGDVDSLRGKIAGTLKLGEEAIATVQRIASELRPKMLDDLGLAPALDWLCTDFSRRTGIACTVTSDIPEGIIGRNAATSLYRFTQEALSNVARHSNADNVSVRVLVADGILNLQVEDDGVGITVEQTFAPKSYGLIGMRERVTELGGNLTVSGETGFGTILLARIPFPKEGTLA